MHKGYCTTYHPRRMHVDKRAMQSTLARSKWQYDNKRLGTIIMSRPDVLMETAGIDAVGTRNNERSKNHSISRADSSTRLTFSSGRKFLPSRARPIAKVEQLLQVGTAYQTRPNRGPGTARKLAMISPKRPKGKGWPKTIRLLQTSIVREFPYCRRSASALHDGHAVLV